MAHIYLIAAAVLVLVLVAYFISVRENFMGLGGYITVDDMQDRSCNGIYRFNKSDHKGNAYYATSGDLWPGQSPYRKILKRSDGTVACIKSKPGDVTYGGAHLFDNRIAYGAYSMTLGKVPYTFAHTPV